MVFRPNNQRNLWKLGAAIGIGSAIAAVIISTSKIAQNKAEWYDWLIVNSCVLVSCLAGKAILVARYVTPTEECGIDEWRIHHSELESYISWRGYIMYQSFAWYRVGDIHLTSFHHQNSLSAEHNKCEALSTITIPPQACIDLAILDTQWAELCARQAELQYVKLLKHGIPPQDAFIRALDRSV
ncbi:hypothetical protein [Chroococcidiopsis sp. TS-821]|uniref:hypothetical protein n=1 Tax=Chroococcidiopsis sp. TS-821 TaxID=1378066 RepID=UPI000CEDA4BD|nr:hypothetical protein [Chroococcidiopsis sp. TS-821]PPS41502.1 hypothetical protein B1A85_17280 [Chroococcidiopsis sp. TS-821]